MENKELQAKAPTDEEKRERAAQLREQIKKATEEAKAKNKEIDAVISSGKGRLTLETPIQSGEETVTELIYDFTELTGLEYADAMDSDNSAQRIYQITSRQALALFAKAAAKQTDGLDMRDIMERIGATDALEGVQLATIFFTGSTRAGRARISKR